MVTSAAHPTEKAKTELCFPLFIAYINIQVLKQLTKNLQISPIFTKHYFSILPYGRNGLGSLLIYFNEFFSSAPVENIYSTICSLCLQLWRTGLWLKIASRQLLPSVGNYLGLCISIFTQSLMFLLWWVRSSPESSGELMWGRKVKLL